MIITNAWICQLADNKVTPIFGDLEIEDGKILSIKNKEFSPQLIIKDYSDVHKIDAQGRVITIPNINFHDHIYSRLAKGLSIKGDLSDFQNILKNLWWKLDLLLNHDMISSSTQMAAIESIKSGVTYIYDHHSSPNCANNSLRIISDELNNFSIRNVLCFETTDRNGDILKNEGLQENINFFENFTSENSKSLLGLHASFTLKDDTLQSVAELVVNNDWGIHIHLCEDILDVELSVQKYGMKPIDRLKKFNILNEKSILAHAIHLEKNEFEIIADMKTALALNIDSNMNNSVGLQKYGLIPNEIPILVGTDGMHSNVAQSRKEFFLQLRNYGLSFDYAFDFIAKSYFDQFNFIKMFFPDFGAIQINDRADLVIWDYVPPTPMDQNNFWSHYIYGILERPAKTVIQNGELLLHDFKLQNIDESKILSNIIQQGHLLYNKFNGK